MHVGVRVIVSVSAIVRSACECGCDGSVSVIM